MADYCKLSAIIVCLGADPHEGLESLLLQSVFRPTRGSQHLCHREMLRTHMTGMAGF